MTRTSLVRPAPRPSTLRLAVALCLLATALAANAAPPPAATIDFQSLPSPILLPGDDHTAYRDPAAIYHDGTFYLYMTVSTIDPDGLIYMQTAWTKSRDLRHWTAPQPFTPKDRATNYSSPGNIIRDGDEFLLCLQTYPTPQKPTPSAKPGAPRWVVQYGDHSSRLWTMRSRDLEHWSAPELLRVKGPDVPQEKMGRLIDPYLVRDKDDPSRWWCFYKEKGQVCYSWSRDLKTWTPAGVGAPGENPCVIVDGDEYVLFYSPRTGIGVKRSKHLTQTPQDQTERPRATELPTSDQTSSQDLPNWRDCAVLHLGLADWDWAQGRLTAGFVLDLRHEPRVGKAIMFFHGSRWPEGDPRGGWANHVSLGIAWSDDLLNWDWPAKPAPLK